MGLVVDAGAIGGRYCEDRRVAEVNDNPAAEFGVRSYALNTEWAAALWLKNCDMAGERF